MAPSTFGRNALGDGSLISNLEEGRSLTMRKARSVVGYMADFEAAIAVCAADGCDHRPGSSEALACDLVGCPLKNREAKAA